MEEMNMSDTIPSVENTCLVVIDFQVALLSAMKDKIANKISKNAVILIEGAKILGLPIIVTEQYPKGLGVTIPPVVTALGDHYKPLEKLSFSIMGEDEIKDAVCNLKVENFLLMGMETHVCILQSALDMKDSGFSPYIVLDAAFSREELDWEVGIDLVKRGGGEITTTETILFQLLKKAGGSEFKEISKLLRNT
jgi:nicotinamidase-related amidase